ncbi:Histone H2B [Trachipleistophora hominis]|uniref:Histone H2B n=1 Tax=Trachipleistophora hominis TaxID=72359 RepID=L7JWR2_TRAHO|nr:Histone H2B [Trachipleistophora hominis]
MASTKSTDPKQKAEDKEHSQRTRRRTNPKNLESSALYKSSVKRLVRERLKDNYTISSAAVTILSSIAFDFFNMIGTTAGDLSKSVNKLTVGATEVKSAIRLELGGRELSNNIVVDMEAAMKKYGGKSAEK